jgi:hypothetical protein
MVRKVHLRIGATVGRWRYEGKGSECVLTTTSNDPSGKASEASSPTVNSGRRSPPAVGGRRRRSAGLSR